MTRLREVLAILSSLSEEGATVSVRGVGERLGVDEDEARRLVSMVINVSDETGLYLPLSISDDGSEISLAFGRGVRGRALRLTRAETVALLGALDQVGLPEDDPARVAVEASFASGEVSPGKVARLLAPLGSPVEAGRLGACARAVVWHRRVTFPYRGSSDDEARTRVADPLGLHQSGGTWYVDAFDVGREDARTFRLDRMGDVADSGAATGHDAAVRDEFGMASARRVTVRFRDAACLRALEWPGIEVMGETDDVTTASVPYLGGLWLPRHIAACGGTAETDDDAVMALAVAYARDELAGSPTAP